MAEIGVYQGDFAAVLLRRCEGLTAYYMIDPWRHLNDWDKPANQDNAVFEKIFLETQAKTDFAGSKRLILRGKTTEVIEQINNGELDFAYIDGDHTLKGIAIDLIRAYPKVRTGGFLCGDDFNQSVWEHTTGFEPTLVFPFAVYFAEAVGANIYALPIPSSVSTRAVGEQFAFVDLTGNYGYMGLRNQFRPEKLLHLWERLSRLMRVVRNPRDFLLK